MAAVWHDNEGHLSVGVLKLPAELLRLLDADIGIVSSMKQKDGTLDLGDMSVRRAFTCNCANAETRLARPGMAGANLRVTLVHGAYAMHALIRESSLATKSESVAAELWPAA